MSEKIWYQDQNAWPTVQPAMPAAMSHRQVRSTPRVRRAFTAHSTAAAPPPTSWALLSTTISACGERIPVLSSSTTTATNAPTAINDVRTSVAVTGPSSPRRTCCVPAMGRFVA